MVNAAAAIEHLSSAMKRAQSLNIETSPATKVSSSPTTTQDVLASGESSTEDPVLPSNSIITDIGLYGVDFTRYNPTAANLDKECRITVALQSALLSTRSAFTKGMTAHLELGIDGKWHDSNLGAFTLHKSTNQVCSLVVYLVVIVVAPWVYETDWRCTFGSIFAPFPPCVRLCAVGCCRRLDMLCSHSPSDLDLDRLP